MRTPVHTQDQPQQPPKRPSAITVLVTLNTVLLLGLALLSFSLHGRSVDTARDNAELRERVATTQFVADSLRHVAIDRLDQLASLTEKRIDNVADRLEKTRAAEVAQHVEASQDLIAKMTTWDQKARGEVLIALRAELRALDDRFKNRLETVVDTWKTEEKAFRQIQKKWDDSIFLVHSEFRYRMKCDGRMDEHTGTGWGTGFVITECGHLVTNKHVVQPWKFDPELAAMVALGEVEILEDTLLVQAWRAGSPCVTSERIPRLELGYNNRALANLSIATMAADHMTTKGMDIAGATIDYQVHKLDNHDLAILKLEGGKADTFHPLVCSPFASRPPLQKLDRVMALGFPRGQRGLEAGIAETSPSLGTVRKIEDTIHITASIIPGNSGGPLFNKSGEVVGVATRIYSETLGICLKIDHVLDLLSTLRDQGAKPIVAEAIAADTVPANAAPAKAGPATTDHSQR